VEGARALDGVAGFVEAPRFYPYMSGRQNLELVAALDGGDAPERIDGALETVDLTSRQQDKVKGYSHGMRQRLGIAGALLRDPRLLLLDEPTTGLDPAGMRDMRALVLRLAGEGITVLLSSHLMSEAEELCDRVAIVSRGRVIHEGALDELIASAAGHYELRTTDDDRAVVIAARAEGVRDVAAAARGLTFEADERAVAALSLALAEEGIGMQALVPRTATLEELFFRLTEGDEEPRPALRVIAGRQAA
jgi:ABC-2 type transport system ATP-binding protein